jgi:hypothetical protein
MLIAIAALLGIVGLALGFSAFAALARARILRFVFRALVSVIFLAAGAVLALFSLGIEGMQALTKEERAARIKVVPSGVQRYDATVTFADGRVETYDLAGDDIYVDGHIVKWTPLANMLGLHTSYRLDRISGRYRTLEQENTARRTVYAIGTPAMIDLVAIGKRLPLADFFDAEYGSASFVPMVPTGELDLMVSTTGLLLRPATPPGTPRP